MTPVKPWHSTTTGAISITDKIRARGEFGIPRRHYFNREDVHVHAFAVGEGQWQDHLDFRDYLRTHEAARVEYAALKRDLQRRYRFDREEYANQKSDFVASILRAARGA